MHLYMMTRGIKNIIDNYIQDLQAQYFPYGKLGPLQLSVRPIQLWELVFPEDQLKEVLKTIIPYEALKSWRTPDWKKKIPLTILRKAFQCKPIPKEFDDLSGGIVRPLRKEAIAVYPFGIKEDQKWTKEDVKNRKDMSENIKELAIGLDKI